MSSEEEEANSVVESTSNDEEVPVTNVDGDDNQEKQAKPQNKKSGKKESKPLKQQIISRDDYHSRSTRAMTKELISLTKSLKKMAKERPKTDSKPFTPNIYNNLKPYYSTDTTWFLFKHPEPFELAGHGQRPTAVGLVEPRISLNMDMKFESVVRTVHPQYKRRKSPRKKADRVNLVDDKESRSNGGSNIIQFPKIQPATISVRGRGQYVDYKDLPKIRDEMRREYNLRRAKRQQIEGQKVIDDFERSKLNELKTRISATSQMQLRSAVVSYFGPPSSAGTTNSTAV
ncbi:hypothetical protein TrispH2_002824 [Trichoplax sp. H2]|uniref:Uncharacterized protein n=1 Tax=Trichoplax adhaerens TaxID=10228 RepID=B3S1I5_TRIAD|nr:hypothetical protein TRIADDRAFT_58302 [Trichoplax adhaerens]EDV23231.1 hypothetical protein TRIADDRAFT_58302 [Trichoplax adhaerens]RDD44727.1 hypothetical protein TrispH2_002824 [Trichoplax sp. H2]|eukprot:XP_002114141.1 hypothetical protein TRIADDRAFT_58302 [Trichoplax adhaerens]